MRNLPALVLYALGVFVVLVGGEWLLARLMRARRRVPTAARPLTWDELDDEERAFVKWWTRN